MPAVAARPEWQRNWGSGRRCSTALANLARKPDTPHSGRKPKRSVEQLEAENQRLRHENAKLSEQREVLKKSLGILSEVPSSGMPESK